MAAAPRGWAPCATAGVLIAIGLACLAAGGYLVSLGGSWYYLLAGLAFAASGVRLWRRSVLALWIYAALVVATLAWAVVEVGLDWWRLTPRGEVVFVLGGLLLTPWIAGRLNRDTGSAVARRGGWALVDDHVVAELCAQRAAPCRDQAVSVYPAGGGGFFARSRRPA